MRLRSLRQLDGQLEKERFQQLDVGGHMIGASQFSAANGVDVRLLLPHLVVQLQPKPSQTVMFQHKIIRNA